MPCLIDDHCPRMYFRRLTILTFLAISPLLPCGLSAQEQAMSFAESRLVAIYEQQEILFAEIEKSANPSENQDLQRRMQKLIADYESFIADNPNNLEALILYGKMLRKIEQPEHAHLVFLRANQIDDAQSVVKQQIGNYLAEEGKYADALGFYLQAINLDPKVALYHFQLGELLATYRDYFIADEILTAKVVDEQLIAAFRSASELSPGNQILLERYAQCFYDVEDCDWEEALKAWNNLLDTNLSKQARQVVHINRANVLLELKRAEEAKAALENVDHPSLEQTKLGLLEQMDGVSEE